MSFPRRSFVGQGKIHARVVGVACSVASRADAVLFGQRDREEWNAEALELSGKVLGHNPEFQTAWAVRRRVLLNGMLPDL